MRLIAQAFPLSEVRRMATKFAPRSSKRTL
jgi:hypothetical protein